MNRYQLITFLYHGGRLFKIDEIEGERADLINSSRERIINNKNYRLILNEYKLHSAMILR